MSRDADCESHSSEPQMSLAVRLPLCLMASCIYLAYHELESIIMINIMIIITVIVNFNRLMGIAV